MRTRLAILSAAILLVATAPAIGQDRDGPSTAEILARATKRVAVGPEEFEREVRRLGEVVGRADADVKVLEALLARRQAEAERARQDVELYRLTHTTPEPDAGPSPSPSPVISPSTPFPAISGTSEMRPFPIKEAPTPPAPSAPTDDPEAFIPPDPPSGVKLTARLFRGRVVGPEGKPVAGATVRSERLDGEPKTSVTTGADGLYRLRVLLRDTPEGPDDTLFSIRADAPGLARRSFALGSLANEPRTIRLDRGAAVAGRVVAKGKGRAGVKVVLVDAHRDYPLFLGDWDSTTDAEGRFRFEGIPQDRQYDLYFTMASLKGDGAIAPLRLAVGERAARVDAGDVEVGPAHQIAGRVALADGRPLPQGASALLVVEGEWDQVQSPLDADGRFELRGVPATAAQLAIVFPDRCFAPRGYRLSTKNKSLDPQGPFHLTGRIDRDLSGLVVLLEPGPENVPPIGGTPDGADPWDLPLAGAEGSTEGPRPPGGSR